MSTQLLWAAYIVFGLLHVGYVASLYRRTLRLRREVEAAPSRQP